MNTSDWPKWKWIGLLAVCSLLVVGIFISFSAYSGYFGFPLDDAWIHQVYARNLVQRGEWSFNPGQSSSGSTSPLWSLLLAGAYVFSVNPVIWTALLGWLALLGTAIFAESLVRKWIPNHPHKFPWIGLFIIAEWHLVWAAVSGMETILFICLVMAAFHAISQDGRRFWVVGLLIGLCTWVRPDGITLLGPAGFVILCGSDTFKRKAQKIFELLGAFLVLFFPYLVFNLNLAGSFWPSTFSAKQAEYQASLSLPFIDRIWSLFVPFLAGGGVILLPGVLAAIFFAWRGRKLETLAVILWFIGYLFMYAIRLPVNYQHGRYMIPAMACFYLTGLYGMVFWMSHWKELKSFNLMKLFWKTCLAAVTLIFLAMGAVAYRTDVAIIESEMVQTARWVQTNTSMDNLVAAHDIGALGYFSDRSIIDMAGLVNPEVIPIIRDETRLKEYLDSKNVDYLITFPGLYPQLTHSFNPIYKTNGKISPQSGGENMAVYSWK